MNNQILAESIAEEILLDIKPYCPTDLTYLFSNTEEGDGAIELRFTPKGEVLRNRLIKTVLKHLEGGL